MKFWIALIVVVVLYVLSLVVRVKACKSFGPEDDDRIHPPRETRR